MTSQRHTHILNAYKTGESLFYDWVRDQLGDLQLQSWEEGAIEMHWEIKDKFVMPDGVVFGGHIAAVADHFVGLATMTVLQSDEERFRTSRLETNFFRPLTPPYASISARVTNVSKTLIHIEADVHNADEKLAARIYAVQVRRLTG
jgi:uncharacterized protein (TIGR00369 family)